MADECANPLLLGWVKEWLDQARDRNSKGATVYKKAYNSLKSCPLPFTHPSEAKQLTGFGDKLCQRLTDKLKDHCEENGLPMPQIPKKKRKRPANADLNEDDDGEGDEDAESAPTKKPRKTKAYVPKVRSGGYAIILALSTLDENSRSGVTKQEVIELAQPHCDASFTAPSDTTKFYTAWKSMDTLNKNDLVYKKGRPEKYYLTDEGWDMAKRMRNTISGNVDIISPSKAKKTSSKVAVSTPSPSKPSKHQAPLSAAAAAAAAALARSSYNDDSFLSLNSSPVRGPAPSPSISPTKAKAPGIIPDGQPVESASSLPEFTPIALPPGSFTVELVLDIREVRSKKDREGVQNELISNGVTPIMRALELGDILWVAKMKDPDLLARLGAEGDEVVLDWIVERKRLDDLIASIKDGRFHDQKFRLRKKCDRYIEAVQTAIASTQVVNGYFVKQTQHLTDSVLYLARLTKMLKGLYEDKPLQVIPTKVITTHNYLPLLTHLRETKPAEEFHTTYTAFASLSSKSDSLTLKDVFLKMLMCVKGVTGEKALEIQKRWKTPNELLEAYE
ncbi:Crossover junction endonuclease, partial [Lachnellula subtilissima]